jgi:hypothetical protein
MDSCRSFPEKTHPFGSSSSTYYSDSTTYGSSSSSQIVQNLFHVDLDLQIIKNDHMR